MRQFLISLFSGLMIAVAADYVIFGGAHTQYTAKTVGGKALDEFNYQLNLLLRKVP
jgi:hypothetical protein